MTDPTTLLALVGIHALFCVWLAKFAYRKGMHHAADAMIQHTKGETEAYREVKNDLRD